jgi:hypothetical protein
MQIGESALWFLTFGSGRLFRSCDQLEKKNKKEIEDQCFEYLSKHLPL